MTKILILEDDFTSALALEAMLSDNGYTVVSCSTIKEKAIELYEREAPDLAMLDININGKPLGIELAEIFQGIRAIPIIFMTAYKEKYFPDAKFLYPAAFFSKPYNEQDLLTAIELSILKQEQLEQEKKASERTSIWLKYNGALHKILIENILSGEADNVYTSIKLKNQSRPLVLTIGLSEFLRKYASDAFLQIHRSWFVNVQHITGYNTHEVTLTDGSTVPVSKTHADELVERLKKD
jgi:DNA-binding LytR/AlgR family response regulator